MRAFGSFSRVRKGTRLPGRDPANQKACRNLPAKERGIRGMAPKRAFGFFWPAPKGTRPSGRNRKAPAGTGGGPVVVLWGEAAGRGSYSFIPFFLIQRSTLKVFFEPQNKILSTAIQTASNINVIFAISLSTSMGTPASAKMI